MCVTSHDRHIALLLFPDIILVSGKRCLLPNLSSTPSKESHHPNARDMLERHIYCGTNHLCSQRDCTPKIELSDLRQSYNILKFPCTGPAIMGPAFSYVAQSARITTVVSNRACDKRCVTCLATLGSH